MTDQQIADNIQNHWIQPGIMGRATVILILLALVPLLIVGASLWARKELRRKRRRSRAKTRMLRLLAAITRPSGKPSLPSPKVRKRRFQGTRGKHYLPPAPDADQDADYDEDAEDALPVPRRPRGFAAAAVPRMDAAHLGAGLSEQWPAYGEDEIDAVVDVLRSGQVNQWTGDRVVAFERAWSSVLGDKRAIALANGSVALELALRAFGVGPGDEVIVTPRSFVASAACVRLVGAQPVFVDVDRESGNMSASAVAAAVTPRTRAVVPVHLGGWPADMPAIMAVARSKGIYVVEDCAQAHGAAIRGEPVGSFGDAAIFSFCQDKIVSTGGEGGLAAFRDDAAYEWAWSFKDHGKDRVRAQERAVQPRFRWLHDRIGTNWRMTETAAAIGLAQLEKLPEWRALRERNAAVWGDALAGVPGLRVPMPGARLSGAFYRLYAYVDVDEAGNERLRERVLKACLDAGLRLSSGTCPEIYREAAFLDLHVPRLPVAKELGETSLAFEVHPTLDPRRLRQRAEAAASIIADVLS